MNIYNSIDKIYTHPIFYSLIKNDVVIYGNFIRSILFENISINDYINTSQSIKCYSLYSCKKFIDRDINDYIESIDKHTNITQISGRCSFYKYKLCFEGIYLNIDFAYINTNLSYYLSYYQNQLSIFTDIDCLYLDREGMGVMKYNTLYERNPIPLKYIMNNIKNKKFKIILNNKILVNKILYKYIISLINKGWENIDNTINYVDINNIENLDYECSICNERHNNNTIKLNECGHLYHYKCLIEFIDVYIDDINTDMVIDYNIKLKCPYCTNDINILEYL